MLHLAKKGRKNIPREGTSRTKTGKSRMHLRKKGRSLWAKHNNERDRDGETLEASAGLKARRLGLGGIAFQVQQDAMEGLLMGE